MKRTSAVLLLAVVPFLAGAALQDADKSPAALVLLVKGRITVAGPASAGGTRSERLLVSHDTMDAGQQLVVSQGAQATLLFWNDGHVEQVIAPGTFKVTRGGCQPRSGIQVVKVAGPSRALLEQCREDFLRRSSEMKVLPRGTGESRHASEIAGADSAGRRELSPVLDSTVLAAKPTFTWHAMTKGKRYTLSLYLLEKPVWSAVTETTKLDYSGEAPLKSDETYSWRVTTILDDGKVVTLCGGVFHTASGQQRATAAALEKLLAKPEPPYLSLAAVWYEQNGLVAEAIAADEQLAKLAPDAGIYRELAELCAWAGRKEDARAAALKATELEKKEQSGTK